MHVHIATKEDWETLKEVHGRAGYGFELPEKLHGLHVAVLDGKIIAGAGYQPAAQIVAIVEPSCVSPAERIRAIELLHAPLARAFLRDGMEAAYAFCDPQFHNFERRMMKIGWSKKLWPCVFLERKDIEAAYQARGVSA